MTIHETVTPLSALLPRSHSLLYHRQSFQDREAFLYTLCSVSSVKVLRKSDEKLVSPTWTLEHIMFTLGGLVPDGLHEEPVLGEHGRVVRDSWLQHQISANISSKGQVVCAKSI